MSGELVLITGGARAGKSDFAADLARDAGIPVWLGGMMEGGVGKGICIELATLDNFKYPADLGNVSRAFERNLADRVPQMTPKLTYEPFTGPLPVPGSGCR